MPAGEESAPLQDRIAKLEKQNDEMLRHLAEFQNRNNEMLQVMKRKDQDLDQRLKFAHEKLVLDLLTRPRQSGSRRSTPQKSLATTARSRPA